MPAFAEDLTLFKFPEKQNGASFSYIDLPQVINDASLHLIRVLPDPSCGELNVQYNERRHGIAASVFKMPPFSKECKLTVLMVDNYSQVQTYVQQVELPQCHYSCVEFDKGLVLEAEEVIKAISSAESQETVAKDA